MCRNEEVRKAPSQKPLETPNSPSTLVIPPLNIPTHHLTKNSKRILDPNLSTFRHLGLKSPKPASNTHIDLTILGYVK